MTSRYATTGHPVTRAHIPGVPRPGEPGWPSRPSTPPVPGTPITPGVPDHPSAPTPVPGPVPPTRVWLDPHADWTRTLYERLLAKRIVLASGLLDDDAASRLSAQLLTLDAEHEDPIRLELQNLRAELPAALTVMGILDVLRVPVHACVSGEISGPALGVLASCPHRSGYPNASFVLAEPRLQLVLLAVFGGIAGLLAMIGIYGVVAYSAARRTREIGIRMALGAAPHDVRQWLLREGMLLGIAGISLLTTLIHVWWEMSHDNKPRDPYNRQ